jgi:ABC-type polysaccharide/polyol phosphate transport system ATPase subunit
MHAIEVDGLSKRYRLGQGSARYSTLRDALTSAARRLVRSGPAARAEEIWALRDVSFEVENGQPLGIIGRNGAGKTTLVKILARVTEPTAGVSRTRGRVGALLEVGTGFHPELTGRENVFLNGAILGMTRRDVRRRFDEIVEFAGVANFMDTPLKRYSSGMALRLAFGVAAHLEADIVVVDEVLAVGDVEFQRRCLGKMSDMTGEGRTVVMISHDLGAVTQICERTIWLDHGEVQADGPSGEVVESYLRSGLAGAASAEFPEVGGRPVEVRAVSVRDDEGADLGMPRRDQPFWVRVRLSLAESAPNLDVAVYLMNRQGVRVLDEAWSDTGMPLAEHGAGDYEVAVRIPGILAPGDYVVGVWVGLTLGAVDETYFHREVLTLTVWPRPDDRAEWSDRNRVLQPPVRWEAQPRDDSFTARSPIKSS